MLSRTYDSIEWAEYKGQYISVSVVYTNDGKPLISIQYPVNGNDYILKIVNMWAESQFAFTMDLQEFMNEVGDQPCQ